MSEKPKLQRVKEFVQANGITGHYREETAHDRAAQKELPYAPLEKFTGAAASTAAGYHAWISREDSREAHLRDTAAARSAELAKAPGREEYLSKVREDAQKRLGRATVTYDFDMDR